MAIQNIDIADKTTLDAVATNTATNNTANSSGALSQKLSYIIGKVDGDHAMPVAAYGIPTVLESGAVTQPSSVELLVFSITGPGVLWSISAYKLSGFSSTDAGTYRIVVDNAYSTSITAWFPNSTKNTSGNGFATPNPLRVAKYNNGVISPTSFPMSNTTMWSPTIATPLYFSTSLKVYLQPQGSNSSAYVLGNIYASVNTL